MEKIITTVNLTLFLVVIFLFPLFFLPTTQEFYQTNKFYLLGLTVLVMLFLSMVRFLFEKKISLVKTPFDAAVLFFLVTQAISVALQSPNKVAAVLSLPTGLAFFLFLTAFYFIAVNIVNKNDSAVIHRTFTVLAAVVSIATVVLFFAPFKNVALPSYLQFLQSPTFTPLGTKIELILVLGFFLVHVVVYMFKQLRRGRASWSKKLLAPATICVITFAALTLSIYAVAQKPLRDDLTLKLPPATTSWHVVVETLKTPTSALFGVGTDNFISLFTRVKTVNYNQTDLWQLNFSKSRSLVLHIWAESGLLGTVALSLIMLVLFKSLLTLHKDKNEQSDYYTAASFYMLLVLLFFPPSLPILFLLYVLLALVGIETARVKKLSLDLSEVVPVYLGFSIIGLLILLGSFYLLGRAYMAEYYFKKSLNALSANSGRAVYDNLIRAIRTNPYNEVYHLTFSQINLLIANNVAAKALGGGEEGSQISDADRQTITQAIQQAILEAKIAVQLNPTKSQNWENLAVIYRNIINAAQGGDAWTIASYQRAILADPINPQLRLSLGGVYYGLKNFPAAAQLFQQAIELKRDWANAHYNLAWTFFQNGNYPEAVAAMQNVLSLVEKSNPDYEKAQKERDEFKEKLPPPVEVASPEGDLIPGEQERLTLPTPPQPEISPKIDLPEESEPPATGEAGVQ